MKYLCILSVEYIELVIEIIDFLIGVVFCISFGKC